MTNQLCKSWQGVTEYWMNLTGYERDDEGDDSDLESFVDLLYKPKEEHEDEADSEEGVNKKTSNFEL